MPYDLRNHTRTSGRKTFSNQQQTSSEIIAKIEIPDENFDYSGVGLYHEDFDKSAIGKPKIRSGNKPKAVASTSAVAEKQRQEQIYRCSICSQILKSRRNLKRHRFLHTGEGGVNCDKCEKSFSTPYNLKSHKYRVHETFENGSENALIKYYPHSCNFCSKRFSTKSQLAGHLFVHTGDCPFKFDECGKAFSRSYTLRKHIAGVHRGKRFGKTHRMIQKCDFCKKQYSGKDSLKNHLLIHTGDMPYKCDACDKGFNRLDTLKNHLKNHTNYNSNICYKNRIYKPRNEERVTDYKCEHCGGYFSSAMTLKRHQELRTNTKPYNCEYCERSFRASSDLKTHTRLHTGEKPYKCGECGQGFTRKDMMGYHIRKKHG